MASVGHFTQADSDDFNFRLCAVDASGAVGAAVAGGDVRLDGTELADPEGVGVGGLSDVRAGGGVLEELLNLHGKAGSRKHASKANPAAPRDGTARIECLHSIIS